MSSGESSNILASTKSKLGIDDSYDVFDSDIIAYINTAFSTLQQLGVGPEEGFSIEGPTEVWNDFAKDVILLGMVRTYVYLKTRLTFDPPATSYAIQAFEKQANDLEWRMNFHIEFIIADAEIPDEENV